MLRPLKTNKASHRWWLALPLLLVACGPDTTTPAAKRRPLYFDVKGLLDQQVQQLTARRAAVTKHVQMRGEKAETVRVPAVKWADELQIFYQADINKAALRGAYQVDSAARPDGQPQRVYTRRPGQDNAPVVRLAVLGASGGEQQITAIVDQENPLFATQKSLRLVLRQGKLVDYNVTGKQKLVLFDSLRYATAGHVE